MVHRSDPPRPFERSLLKFYECANARVDLVWSPRAWLTALAASCICNRVNLNLSVYAAGIARFVQYLLRGLGFMFRQFA